MNTRHATGYLAARADAVRMLEERADILRNAGGEAKNSGLLERADMLFYAAQTLIDAAHHIALLTPKEGRA